MDVSGSMTDDQKEIVRIEAFWIDTWLKSQYDGVTTRYIIHDAVAREVDEHTFYHTRESGGTRISSAYNLANKIIDDDAPADRLEHLRPPLLRRRQLGRGQPPVHQPAPRPAPAQVQPLRLRPGREPLRLGRVLPRARGGVRRRAQPGPLRDPQQGRDLRVDQGIPGPGAVTIASSEVPSDGHRDRRSPIGSRPARDPSRHRLGDTRADSRRRLARMIYLTGASLDVAGDVCDDARMHRDAVTRSSSALNRIEPGDGRRPSDDRLGEVAETERMTTTVRPSPSTGDRCDSHDRATRRGDQCVDVPRHRLEGVLDAPRGCEANVRVPTDGLSRWESAARVAVVRRTNASRSGSGVCVIEVVVGARHPLHPGGLDDVPAPDRSEAGVEGDQTYYLANEARIRGKKQDQPANRSASRPGDRGRRTLTTPTRRSRSTAGSECPRSGSATRTS